MNAAEACADLEENPQRKISRHTGQSLADRVGGIAQLKEESWEYALPELEGSVTTVVCRLDGADWLTANDGWREAMVGTLSLYDAKGERRHTTYWGAAPEYGKDTFLKRYEKEPGRLKARYPDAGYVGIADGSKTNGTFLSRQTCHQMLDFYHVTEYLGKVAPAAYPQKTGKPKRQPWLADRWHQLKPEEGTAQRILDECYPFRQKRSLTRRTVKEALESTMTYFENQQDKMNYAAHRHNRLPMGSGVVEAAGNTLVKQRFWLPPSTS